MKIHIVKQGESLYSIAQKYGVTLDEVIQMNPGIVNPDQIDVGMKVKIPTSTTVSPGVMEIMHKHSVQQGDTLWKLSKAWGVSLNDMIKANPQLKNPNALLVGEVVNIPKSTVGTGMANIPETGTVPKWHKMLPKEKVPTVPIEPLPHVPKVEPLPYVPKIEPLPHVPKIEPLPHVPKIEPLPHVPKVKPLPPAPEKLPKKIYPPKPEIKPHTDLFKQMKVPATEVMAMPTLPKYPNMPFHSPMPYGIGPSVLDTSNQWPLSTMNLPAGNMYPGVSGAPVSSPAIYSTPGDYQPMGMHGYDNVPMMMPTGYENLPMGVHGTENIPMTMPTAFENQPMMMPTAFENQPMMMPTAFENQPMMMPAAFENQPMGVHGYENVPMPNQPMGMYGYDNVPVTAPGAFENVPVSMPGYPGYYPAGYETAAVHPTGWNTAGPAYPMGPMYPQSGPYGTGGQTAAMTDTATVQNVGKPCGCYDHRKPEQKETDFNAQQTSGPAKKQSARRPARKSSAKAKVSSKKAEQKRGSFPWLNS